MESKVVNLNFDILDAGGNPTGVKASIVFADEQTNAISQFRALQYEVEAIAMEYAQNQFRNINEAYMTNSQYEIVNGWLNNNYTDVRCPFYGISLIQLKDAFNNV